MLTRWVLCGAVIAVAAGCATPAGRTKAGYAAETAAAFGAAVAGMAASKDDNVTKPLPPMPAPQR
jgi:hypothetical protein